MARLRRISAVRKEDLLERARALRDSVAPLLPGLTADCPSDRFDRLREELEEVRAVRDDADRLERHARRGDPLVRAYAGLLRYSLDPKDLAVATVPVPGGEIPYAPLARTEPQSEVAVQHYNDPDRLLLGYLDWSKRGFHFFAGNERLWCTGRSDRPPPEVRAAKLADLPYRLSEDSSHRELRCTHLSEGESRPFLEVGWPGADVRLRVCDRCVRPDRHLLSSLSDGVAAPDPVAEFPVRVSLNVRCRAGAECVHARVPDLSRALRQAYERGRIDDATVLREYVAEVRPRVEETRAPTYVVNGNCFGADRSAFLAELRPTPLERGALERALQESPGYFSVDRASAGQALEQLWPSHSEVIVRSIIQEPKEAQKMLDELRGAPPGRVAEVLKRVQRYREEREVLGALPRYERLTPEAAYVDRIARTFRTQGEAGAERTILEELPREGGGRSLGFALLVALGRADPHQWRFSETEQSFGRHLAEMAKAVLRGPVPDYHDGLNRLLLAAGVANWGVRISG